MLTVRVQPRARREAVGGRAEFGDGAALKVSVTQAPEDGRANAAVVAALASALDVAKRDIVLVTGASARIKRFKITGDVARLVSKLTVLAQQ